MSKPKRGTRTKTTKDKRKKVAIGGAGSNLSKRKSTKRTA